MTRVASKPGRPRSTPRAEIDTLGFAFKVDSHFETTGAKVTISNYDTEAETFRYQHALPGGGFIGLGVGGKAWVEASLPKRTNDEQSNVRALPVGEALEVARAMYDEARTVCTPEESFDESKIVRLDVVRDFAGVRQLGPMLDGLAMVPLTGRAKRRRFADAESNNAETLRVGPKAWACTLYDKFTETRGDVAAAGQLRFEARLHHAQLTSVFAKEHGAAMGVIADVTDAKCEAMRWSMFHRVGFDRAVPATESIAEYVWACDELSPARRGAFWAYLTLPGFGAALSDPTERKYRRLAESMGLAPGRGVPELVGARVMRLDYLTGAQEFRAAA